MLWPRALMRGTERCCSTGRSSDAAGDPIPVAAVPRAALVDSTAAIELEVRQPSPKQRG